LVLGWIMVLQLILVLDVADEDDEMLLDENEEMLLHWRMVMSHALLQYCQFQIR
jgi:hypothetical protein